jgi:hypothetical protein
MAINEKVSGVGANSSRTDNNVSERVKKIQREAKIENANGGSYSERSNLSNLTAGNPTPTGSAVSSNPAAPSVPISSQLTPNELLAQRQSPDAGAVLIRAMYMANPSPYLRRMVEAYDAEGLY